MSTIHTLALILILAGILSIAWGALSTFADGMSDQPGVNSGGCTFVIGGAIAIVVGIVGMFL